MKNLANCKPSEFLKQANRIRKSVAKWLTLTDVMNIRKRMPSLPEGADDKSRKEAMDEQVKANLNAILEAVMEDHPDETLEILALVSFVEPEDVDSRSVSEYLGSFADIINDENVMRFFTSLLSLGRRAGSRE